MIHLKTRTRIEAALAVVGLALVGSAGFAWATQQVLSERDLARFHAARTQIRAAGTERIATGDFVADSLQQSPDQRLWSESRKRDYANAIDGGSVLPLGVMRVPSISLEVPILDGTDEWTLNRAVGRVPGTAQIGGPGNFAIAGHRDGFFRPLKDIERGDTIELLTLTDSYRYEVSDIWIVDPDETGVLAPSSEPVLTLVTCYPFYFVGDAPQRFIVRAVLQ